VEPHHRKVSSGDFLNSLNLLSCAMRIPASRNSLHYRVLRASQQTLSEELVVPSNPDLTSHSPLPLKKFCKQNSPTT
jgi:hypothetical protein